MNFFVCMVSADGKPFAQNPSRAWKIVVIAVVVRTTAVMCLLLPAVPQV